MHKRKSRYEELKLNMTPMIDVVMLLIVFFLVASKFKSAETDILSLACARNVDRMESPRTPARFIINVRYADPETRTKVIYTHQGVIHDPSLDDDVTRLLRKVRNFRRVYPDGEVVIRADGRIKYRYISVVHAVCRDAGAEKVSFAVNPVVKESR